MGFMKRWLPLLGLLLILAMVVGSGWHRHLTWAALAANQAVLLAFVAQHPPQAAGLFVALYALAAAAAIPGLGVLSLAGGLLFGMALGSLLVSVGATLGAVLLFLAARTALAEPLARRFATLAGRLRPGLTRDGFSYLLALRLISVTPFSIGSLAAAMVGMPLAPFVAATFLGVLPSTLVFAALGASLGTVLASGQEPELSLLLSPAILLPFLGLAALALLPVAWRRWKSENG